MNNNQTAVRNPLCDNSTWIKTFVKTKVSNNNPKRYKSRHMHVNYLTANER